MKKIIPALAGVVLIIVGVIGWLIPVLPGWPLVFLGLSLIAPVTAARLRRRILRHFSKKEIVYLENWKKFGVHAGFTTRHFPLVMRNTADLSERSLQLEFERLLSESRVLSSHRTRLGSKFVYLNQVHGDTIAVLEDASQFRNDGFYCLPETDGVLTARTDLTLLVMTADCLPIFFLAGCGKAGPQDQRRWIGLIHAGWRGTQKEITKQALQRICEKSLCDSSEIRVVFGPRIGRRRYKVGKEFLDYFGFAITTRYSPVREKNGGWYFDLAGENRRQLIAAGARPDHIQDLEICTVDENDDYYSFRKEKDDSGRNVSFISRSF